MEQLINHIFGNIGDISDDLQSRGVELYRAFSSGDTNDAGIRVLMSEMSAKRGGQTLIDVAKSSSTVSAWLTRRMINRLAVIDEVIEDAGEYDENGEPVASGMAIAAIPDADADGEIDGDFAEAVKGFTASHGSEDIVHRTLLDFFLRHEHNPRLREILMLVGRFTKIAAKVKRVELREGFAPYDVQLGDVIADTLDNDLVSLGLDDDDAEAFFYYKMLRGELLNWERKEKIPVGAGDFIIALDISSSMFGCLTRSSKSEITRYDAACGLTIALAVNAMREGRNVEIIRYNENAKSQHYTKRDVETMIESLVNGYVGGGTDYECVARSLVNRAGIMHDIVTITDGDMLCHASTMQRLIDRIHSDAASSTFMMIGTTRLPARIQPLADVSTIVDLNDLNDADANISLVTKKMLR